MTCMSKRKKGKGYTQVMLDIPDDQGAQLISLAAKMGCTLQELILKGIESLLAE
jgi:hypothetical protein